MDIEEYTDEWIRAAGDEITAAIAECAERCAVLRRVRLLGADVSNEDANTLEVLFDDAENSQHNAGGADTEQRLRVSRQLLPDNVYDTLLYLRTLDQPSPQQHIVALSPRGWRCVEHGCEQVQDYERFHTLLYELSAAYKSHFEDEFSRRLFALAAERAEEQPDESE